jgi:hypothetical protein
VIVEVERNLVKTRDAYETAMRKHAKGGILLLLVRRRDTTRYISMQGR